MVFSMIACDPLCTHPLSFGCHFFKHFAKPRTRFGALRTLRKKITLTLVLCRMAEELAERIVQRRMKAQVAFPISVKYERLELIGALRALRLTLRTLRKKITLTLVLCRMAEELAERIVQRRMKAQVAFPISVKYERLELIGALRALRLTLRSLREKQDGYHAARSLRSDEGRRCTAPKRVRDCFAYPETSSGFREMLKE